MPRTEGNPPSITLFKNREAFLNPFRTFPEGLHHTYVCRWLTSHAHQYVKENTGHTGHIEIYTQRIDDPQETNDTYATIRRECSLLTYICILKMMTIQ